jgi:hypothetical protein
MSSAIEKNIAKCLVEGIIARGFVISVDDGGAIAIKRSFIPHLILDAMFSSDGDILVIRDRANPEKRIGSIALIYGNGAEVISDYTDNPEIHGLVERAQKAAGQ